MAIDVHTFNSSSDMSNLTSDWRERAQPTLMGLGALEATGWMVLTGPMTGLSVASTRWESMGQWAEAMGALAAHMAKAPSAFMELKAAMAQRLEVIAAPLQRVYEEERLGERLGELGAGILGATVALDDPALLPLP